MATTSNYGWTTPDDTALVKDGASAIRSLGTAIDTSLNTALGTKKAGMVLLNTTSFSAVASQSINTVFNSTYDNYKLLIRITASSTGNAHRLRMRASGTDESGSNYFSAGGFEYFNSSTLGGDNSNAIDHFPLGGGTASATGTGYFLELLSPNLAQKTVFSKQGVGENGTYAYITQLNGIHNLTTAYDGFSVYASTGTITGTVSVYGYNK
jgi:hypothetical protein